MFLDELKSIFGYRVSPERKLGLAKREVERIQVAEEELENQRILALHERYISGGIEEEAKGYIQNLSSEETIKLDIARKDIPIYDRPFRSLTIVRITPATDGTPAEAYLRFGNVASPRYLVRRGEVSGKFKQILFSNTAQPGASITYITSQNPDTHFNMLQDERILVGTVPHIYDVTLTLADTEYSQLLPPSTTYLKTTLTDGTPYKFSFEKGAVEAASGFIYQPADIPFVLNGMRFFGKTFYFASVAAGKKMSILVLQ